MGLTSPVIEYLLALVLGPVVGSFISAYISRLPDQCAGILLGRSRCPHCGIQLAWSDLIPLYSFLSIKGRCRYCGLGLSWIYPAAEWGALAVALVAAWLLDGREAYIAMALGWVLLALTLSDVRDHLLPDLLTLPLIPLGLLQVWWLVGPGAVLEHGGAAISAAVLLMGLRLLYQRLRNREGLGLGDVKLTAAAGAWLGLAPLPWLFVSAGALALAVLGLGRIFGGPPLEPARAVPFGAFLAPVIWIIWVIERLHAF